MPSPHYSDDEAGDDEGSDVEDVGGNDGNIFVALLRLESCLLPAPYNKKIINFRHMDNWWKWKSIHLPLIFSLWQITNTINLLVQGEACTGLRLRPRSILVKSGKQR